MRKSRLGGDVTVNKSVEELDRLLEVASSKYAGPFDAATLKLTKRIVSAETLVQSAWDDDKRWRYGLGRYRAVRDLLVQWWGEGRKEEEWDGEFSRSDLDGLDSESDGSPWERKDWVDWALGWRLDCVEDEFMSSPEGRAFRARVASALSEAGEDRIWFVNTVVGAAKRYEMYCVTGSGNLYENQTEYYMRCVYGKKGTDEVNPDMWRFPTLAAFEEDWLRWCRIRDVEMREREERGEGRIRNDFTSNLWDRLVFDIGNGFAPPHEVLKGVAV